MKTLLILFFWCIYVSGYGQVQEIEQLKINLQKLVQLKLMLSQAKQGYQTLQNGYNAVRDAAKGNFDLHKNYLNKLLQVSMQVKNAPAMKRFMDNQASIIREYREWYGLLSRLGLLKPAELSTIQSSYQQITGLMSDNLDQLQVILSPGKLRMSDAERIAAIELLGTKSDEQLIALRELLKQQNEIAAVRARDKYDRQAIMRLYGIK